MDNFSSGMQSLCEDIIADHNARKIAMAFVKDDSKAVRGDARLLIGQLRNLKQRKAKALRKELREYRRALMPAAGGFLKECRRRRTQTRSDMLSAGRVWRAMAAGLKIQRGEEKS